MSDWMFEAAATPQPTMWDDPALAPGSEWSGPKGADHGDAAPALEGGKGGLTEFDLVMFSAMGGADNADGADDGEATTLDDVISTGPRHDHDDPYDDWWETGGFPTGSTGDGPSGDENAGGTGNGGETQSSQSDESCRSVDDQTGPSQPGDDAAIDKLKNVAIPETTKLLNAIPGGTVFTMPDGADVTIEELRTLWSRADFEVLRNFAPPNGQSSEADRNGGNPIFRVDVDRTLENYMLWPDGPIYYALHELSHVTVAGDAFGRSNPGFVANEGYANALVVAITAAAGQPITAASITSMNGTTTSTGAQTSVGNGPLGSINPNSPCG